VSGWHATRWSADEVGLQYIESAERSECRVSCSIRTGRVPCLSANATTCCHVNCARRGVDAEDYVGSVVRRRSRDSE
jgi:hypothetical protein